jgi:surface antigen/peptidoglycan hydrolase CwlO-like protein
MLTVINKIKTMKKILNVNRNLGVSKRFMLASLASIVVVGSSTVGLRVVNAQSIQDQINALQQENTNNQNAVNQLRTEARSYEDAISQLQGQINGLQAQIDANTRQQEDLQKKIEEAEAELKRQQALLGKNIREMYIEGDISTLEMLASSNDLSEFVDKQEYRTAVKNKITTTLEKINTLKHELKGKKESVDKLIKEQQDQRAQLAASRAEQSNLLSYNQSQQAEFNEKSKTNRARIAELLERQAREAARRFGGGGGQVGGGGYPWGTAPCLSGGHVKGRCDGFEWGYNGSWRNWNLAGYAYRNCTDYVAWKVYVTKGFAPGGLGHGGNWYNNADGRFDRGNSPRVGAAAVDPGTSSNPYGHVMYVEAVNNDGSIVISDYNRAGPGEYGTATLSVDKANGLKYVYF